jgi:large subunit ribosomal protein L11
MTIVEVLVPGGKATPSPPLGPALGPLGVNVKEIIDKINEETKAFNGIQVPIKIIIDDNNKRQFTIQIGVPPTSALIKKELKIETASGKPNKDIVGNLTMKQLTDIVQMKKGSSFSKGLKNVAKEIVGTCSSMGVTIEGMKAKAVTTAINDGKFDSVFSE